jgi:hypothetical protein
MRGFGRNEKHGDKINKWEFEGGIDYATDTVPLRRITRSQQSAAVRDTLDVVDGDARKDSAQKRRRPARSTPATLATPPSISASSTIPPTPTCVRYGPDGRRFPRKGEG